MTEPTAAPAVPEPPVETPAPAAPAKPAPPSNSTLVLGFIILVLLGAILALNLKPRAMATESPGQVAARIKKDSDTLISLNGRVQSQIDQKDAQIIAGIKELRDVEVTNRMLASQNAALQNELDRAKANGGDVEPLKRQLSQASLQVESLKKELGAARAQLAEHANAPSTGDFDDLKRRLDETDRAKAFFETRVKELEAKLPKTN